MLPGPGSKGVNTRMVALWWCPVTSGVASSSLTSRKNRVGMGRDLGGLRVLPTTSLVSPTGQHHSDAFVQVNPLKKVPALKDGDFTLAER